MIQNSFIFLEGVGNTLEKNLWEQNITSWTSFINSKNIKGISKKRKLYYDRQLMHAQHSLNTYNTRHFLDLLPQSEMWRLYSFFKDEAVFLDLETTGVNNYDQITVVGLYDGLNTKTMIKGINLDFNNLKQELKHYKLIITFNGSTFDIPFIKKRYPELLPDIPNFDLRVACQRVGLTGGLKQIEKQLGIERNNIIERLCNGDPLTLWRMAKASGDDYYLKLLVEYNEEDCYNLKKIADYVTKELENGNIRKS